MTSMQQVADFDFPVHGCGGDDIFDGHDAARDAWGEDRVKDRNSGLLAMAYLWRRFGPPWRGGDDHKSLVDYTLTTEDPYVFLWLNLSGCGLAYSVGYFAHESIWEENYRPTQEWHDKFLEWWWLKNPEWEEVEETEENRKRWSKAFLHDQCDEAVIAEARQTIGDVYDSAFPRPRPDSSKWRTNEGVIGRVGRAIYKALKELERPVYVRDCPLNIFGRCQDDFDTPAECSPYAGCGIPKDAMDEWIKDD